MVSKTWYLLDILDISPFLYYRKSLISDKEGEETPHNIKTPLVFQDGDDNEVIISVGGPHAGAGRSPKCLMSKQYYLTNKSLHQLSMFSSKVDVIQVGNGICINILLVIPIIITIQGHMFQIYIMVSEIHENVGLALGIKIIVELEAAMSMRELKFKFMNRSVPEFPVNKIMVKPKRRKF